MNLKWDYLRTKASKLDDLGRLEEEKVAQSQNTEDSGRRTQGRPLREKMIGVKRRWKVTMPPYPFALVILRQSDNLSEIKSKSVEHR
jgi:hypothetical protein